MDLWAIEQRQAEKYLSFTWTDVWAEYVRVILSYHCCSYLPLAVKMRNFFHSSTTPPTPLEVIVMDSMQSRINGMFAYKWAVRDRRLQLNGFSETRLITRRQTVWCRHFFFFFLNA